MALGTDDEGLDHAGTVLVLLAADTTDSRQRFRCNGITRLEKLMFLLKTETKFVHEQAEAFTFEPYHYGPYSKEVYDAVDFLGSMKLLVEKRVDVGTGLDVSEESDTFDRGDLNQLNSRVERQLILTDDGKAIAKLLSTKISPEGKQILTDVKDRFGKMPLRQLLKYVYTEHPDYASKSKIRDSVL